MSSGGPNICIHFLSSSEASEEGGGRIEKERSRGVCVYVCVWGRGGGGG